MCAFIIYGYFTSIYSIYYTKAQKFALFRQNFTPLKHPSATDRCASFRCNFELILCKTTRFLHKNKNFCISDFSKKSTNSTNIANILNFVCQICNFLQSCFGELFCKIRVWVSHPIVIPSVSVGIKRSVMRRLSPWPTRRNIRCFSQWQAEKLTSIIPQLRQCRNITCA